MLLSCCKNGESSLTRVILLWDNVIIWVRLLSLFGLLLLLCIEVFSWCPFPPAGQYLLRDRPLSCLMVILSCDLWNRQNVTSLCMFYKDLDRADHSIRLLLPECFVPQGRTWFDWNQRANTLEHVQCMSNQFSRSFIPSMVALLTDLDNDMFSGGNLTKFQT